MGLAVGCLDKDGPSVGHADTVGGGVVGCMVD